MQHPSSTTRPTASLDSWERHAHAKARRMIYGLFTATGVLMVPLGLATGDLRMTGLAVVSIVVLLAGYRMADAEHRNGLALALLSYLNVVLFVASAHLGVSMAAEHVMLLFMSFALVERERVVVQRLAMVPPLVSFPIEAIGWQAHGAPGSTAVIGLWSATTALGSLAMMVWLTRTRDGMIERAERAERANRANVGAPRDSVSSVEVLPPWAGRARALVADDNTVNLKVASRYLEKLGCEVYTATDGREAVSLAREVEPDVVFMDVQMPEMDGFEATRAIRAQQEGTGRRLPIVAMTAHAMTGYRELCLQAGMDGYIAKPLRIADLAQALRRWLGGPGTGDEPPAAADPHGVLASIDEDSAPAGVLGRLDDAPMLDRLQLDEVTDGDPEEARELLRMLFETGSAGLEQAASAVRRGGDDVARGAIHSLKGAASTLGASRLALACKRVEALRPEQLPRGLDELLAEFAALRAQTGHDSGDARRRAT